jgi:catalase
MSERGVPDGFRHMDGFSSHTYKWVNDKGEAFWVQYHFKTDQGNKGLSAEKVREIEATTLDYNTEDLYSNI